MLDKSVLHFDGIIKLLPQYKTLLLKNGTVIKTEEFKT